MNRFHMNPTHGKVFVSLGIVLLTWINVDPNFAPYAWAFINLFWVWEA